MSEPVPAEDIERIVGAERLQTAHLARWDGERLYVLHSQDCRDSYVDLTQCPMSLCMDLGKVRGITPYRPTLVVRNPRGEMVPDLQAAGSGKAQRLPGHGLWNEGAPHDLAGVRIMHGARYVGVYGEGRALCACGERSPILPSAHQRRKWHREVHKPEVAHWHPPS